MIGGLWKYLGGGLLFVCLMLGIALNVERRGHAKARQRIVELTELRVSDRARYEAAQREAAEKNRANVARIEADQRRITHEVQSDLTARLERLRRELRANPQANPGPAGGAGSPAAPVARPGAPQETRLCPSAEELLRGAENEERHDQLITWIERQLKDTK
jgi:predicted phage gp36 major capsid-like protein